MMCSTIQGVVIAVVVGLISITSPAVAFQNEPDDFRGIKWGTNIKDIIGMQCQSERGNEKSYSRLGDKMAIGNAPLTIILYDFYKDRFSGVSITYEGESAFDSLKRTLTDLHGKPSRPNVYVENYVWSGALVDITFEYSDFSKRGTIYYFYKPIIEEEQRDKKTFGKKGAADQ